MSSTTKHAPHSVAAVSDRGSKDDARPSPRASRTGFTLVECLVAAALLAVVMTLAAQLFVWDARERREVWRRQVAQQEAASVLERFSLTPYEEITEAQVQQIALSPETLNWLSDGKLTVSLEEVTTPRPGKRLRVEIHWGDANVSAPVRLTGWRFAPEGTP
jgi:prepilin-type N-terminal cleavage/methylation domain-containing protein